MIFSEATAAAKNLFNIVPLLGGSTSESDYESALALVEYLIEHEPTNELIPLLEQKISDYEDNAPEFAKFNRRLQEVSNGVAVLAVLIDQYGLKQSDFENEIGKKALVSRILSGERQLTLEHMRALSIRFNIPITTFLND